MAGQRGKPKGLPKSGGRQPGTLNRRTKEVMAAVEATGLTPLEVMVAIMRDAFAANDHEKALDAASKAAPYVHAKLSSVDLKASVKRSAAELTRDELLAIAALAHSGGTGGAAEGRRAGESDSLH